MIRDMVRVPLTCPLPEMDSTVNPETGKWYHIPWTDESKKRALAAHFKLVPRRYVENV